MAAGANDSVWTLHRTSNATARLARLVGDLLQEVPAEGPGTTPDISAAVLQRKFTLATSAPVSSIDLDLRLESDPGFTPQPAPYVIVAAASAIGFTG